MTSPDPLLSRRSLLLAPLLAAGVWPLAHADLTMEQRLPLVRPRAARLRRYLRSGAVDPTRVEADYAAALARAEAAWETVDGDRALLALAPLQKYAPIAELPFIKAQLLMAAIAQEKRQSDLLRHHRAFATALVELIDASGDGLTEATALKLVLPSEADGWFIAHHDRYTPIARMLVGKRRHSHDLWRVRDAAGVERTLYFDVSAMLRGSTPARRRRRAG